MRNYVLYKTNPISVGNLYGDNPVVNVAYPFDADNNSEELFDILQDLTNNCNIWKMVKAEDYRKQIENGTLIENDDSRIVGGDFDIW